MKHFLIFTIATLLNQTTIASSPEPNSRYYIIPLKNLKISSRIIPRALETFKDLSLVKMQPSDVSKLSALLHKELNICGGYIDVTDEFLSSKTDMKSFISRQLNVVTPNFDKTTPNRAVEVNSTISKLDRTRFWDFLQLFTSFSDRSALTQEGVKAANWLGEHALKIAKDHSRSDITVRYFKTGGTYIQPSTVVKIPGNNSSLPAVVIGAHMDTFSKDKPGTDDDGTGVATVMETFQAVLESGLKFERDIYFAFYAAEERGLVGSGVVAKTMVSEGLKIRGVVQFDMTGFKSPKDAYKIYLIEDNVDPVLTAFLKTLIVNYVGIPANQIGTDKCTYACSDHAQWQRNGVPAALPFEASLANDNKAIHTANDKINLLDIEHALPFVKLSIAFVVEAAEPL